MDQQEFEKQNPVGTRVYAVRNETDDVVFVFGFGTYDGVRKTTEPATIASPFGQVPIPIGSDIPVIKLDDSSDLIWAYECWWGPESEFEKQFKNKTVIKVNIKKERAEARASKNSMEANIAKAGAAAEAYLLSVGADRVGLITNDGVREYVSDDGKKIYVVSAFLFTDEAGVLQDPKDLKKVNDADSDES